jgi:hypothetical protein
MVSDEQFERVIGRIGFFFYLAAFPIVAVMMYAIAEGLFPMVPNPEYDPTKAIEVRERCYNDYGPGGAIPVCLTEIVDNAPLIRRFGWMGGTAYGALLSFGIVCAWGGLVSAKKWWLREVWDEL